MLRSCFLALTIGLTMLTGSTGFAEADCDSAAACSTAAKTALEGGDREAALSSLLRQVDLATGERFDNGNSQILLCNGFDNLARLLMQMEKPLQANAWVQEALGDCIADDARKSLAKEIAATLPNQNNQLGGRYWSYAGYGQWSEMTLADRGNGKFEVQWFVQRYGLVPSAEGSGPAAMWEFEGTGELKEGRFIVQYAGVGSTDAETGDYGEGTPCEIDFAVRPVALEIVTKDLPVVCQNGGWNAYPRGTFWRVEPE